MNERVQKIWRECVLKHTKDPMNWQTVADEFAELMVNEFDRVLLSYWIDSIGNRDKKTANYIDYIRIRTKIYFGVEE